MEQPAGRSQCGERLPGSPHAAMLAASMTSAASDNPLLDIQHPIPFASIRAEHVEPAIAVLLEDSRAQIAQLERPGVTLDYAHTLDALENATQRLERAMTVVGHLEQVATTPAKVAIMSSRPRPSSGNWNSSACIR